MTNKEAIERLKQNKAAAEFYAGMTQISQKVENELKDIEAFEMAIEALQKDIERHEMVIRASERHLGLVRCKDCIHSDPTNGYVEDVVYCKRLHTSCIKSGYCHRGERRTNTCKGI